MSSGQGACRVRSFHGRLSDEGMAYMDDKINEWLALERNEVVPALKKAGIKRYTVFQTLIGDTNEFLIVRPLPTSQSRRPSPTAARSRAGPSSSVR